ncbi:MAG: DNA mismatch repair protein MutS [Saprospiraceae bacterium]|nr:DNA mismatch repair protein MutS [Saprospiraceae bacterium]
MEQYFKVKKKYPQTILLFRVGDFYETFGQDAITTSKILGIILTSRNNGGSDVELAGFPFHSLDMYLPRLVKAGYRVAICEQLEKPSKEKKIVKRGVTEIVTPGVVADDNLLDHRRNNFLASVHLSSNTCAGVAFLDLSTGEFFMSEGDITYVEKLFQSFPPSEVIFSKDKKKWIDKQFGEQYFFYALDEWIYTHDYAREKLLNHFDLHSLKGFGIEDLESGQIAGGAILQYLGMTENNQIPHIRMIQRIIPDDFVWMDKFTIRNLELLESNHPSGVAMIDVIDHTVSPMGSRLLKKWLLLPLKSTQAIEERLNAVDKLHQDDQNSLQLGSLIKKTGDLERLISKISLSKANPRDLLQLAKALAVIPQLQKILSGLDDALLNRLGEGMHPCSTLRSNIEERLVENPPVNLQKGEVIRGGISKELDEFRYIISHSKELLLQIQQQEATATGINNLKIGYNNVFGYYLEVTNKYKNQGMVPDSWIRKQTLTGSERYITEELKELETKILSAEEKAKELESQLFEQLLIEALDYIQPVQFDAHQIAKLDCLLSFATIARKFEYCRPGINESLSIHIKDGRHPVIESQMEPGEHYVPNDITLDSEDTQIMMITGPNMSGKSALLRQTALICIMAQIGSFVPAAGAEIGIIDKIFTRVGASDNISSGESTFMVEMNETASIMNNISDRSLILLDEIGRGTSTYDGISIAWSIAEYLHQNELAAPKTLFATHYHELNELADKFERIKNYHISTHESGHKVIFLRKLEAGGSEHSFGIHVAKMAGMPASIIKRAATLLHQMEQKSLTNGKGRKDLVKDTLAQISNQEVQLNIFEQTDPIALKIKEDLNNLDVNSMTPIECMLKLNELKALLDEVYQS